MEHATTPRRRRRSDGLSADAIVHAAIVILDTHGEEALTFRSLADALETGPGAIYHHLENKREILGSATGRLVAQALAEVPTRSAPADDLRELMRALFNVIDAHPWIGGQLAREPWQSAVSEIFAALGEHLERLDVPEKHLFAAASSMVNLLLGVAGQYAAAARLSAGTDRTSLLRTVADQWRGDDSTSRSFAHRMADRLADHDDRQQFLDGVEFLLAGITATTRKPGGHPRTPSAVRPDEDDRQSTRRPVSPRASGQGRA